MFGLDFDLEAKMSVTDGLDVGIVLYLDRPVFVLKVWSRLTYLLT